MKALIGANDPWSGSQGACYRHAVSVLRVIPLRLQNPLVPSERVPGVKSVIYVPN